MSDLKQLESIETSKFMPEMYGPRIRAIESEVLTFARIWSQVGSWLTERYTGDME